MSQGNRKRFFGNAILTEYEGTATEIAASGDVESAGTVRVNMQPKLLSKGTISTCGKGSGQKDEDVRE